MWGSVFVCFISKLEELHNDINQLGRLIRDKEKSYTDVKKVDVHGKLHLNHFYHVK